MRIGQEEAEKERKRMAEEARSCWKRQSPPLESIRILPGKGLLQLARSNSLKVLEGSELAERVARLEQKMKELGSDKVKPLARYR